MNESARSMPVEERPDATAPGAPAPPYAPSTWNQSPAVGADVGDAGQVVDGARRSSRRRSPPPRRRRHRRRRRASGPERVAGQPPALVVGDRQHVDVHHARGRRHARVHGVAGGDPPPVGTAAARASAAAWRAVTSAERFPGRAARHEHAAGLRREARPGRRSTASAWFSAQIAPAPSIHPAAIVDDAPTIRSNRTDAFVGAPGTNANAEGWSVEIVAGASTSAQSRSASSQPMPPGEIV